MPSSFIESILTHTHNIQKLLTKYHVSIKKENNIKNLQDNMWKTRQTTIYSKKVNIIINIGTRPFYRGTLHKGISINYFRVQLQLINAVDHRRENFYFMLYFLSVSLIFWVLFFHRSSSPTVECSIK